MLKYRIDQFVEKIKAPIICQFGNQRMMFENGNTLAMYEFENSYDIESLIIEDGKVVVGLKERSVPNINSIGDELIPGGSWIEEHRRLYGRDPNLFDGA